MLNISSINTKNRSYISNNRRSSNTNKINICVDSFSFKGAQKAPGVVPEITKFLKKHSEIFKELGNGRIIEDASSPGTHLIISDAQMAESVGDKYNNKFRVSAEEIINGAKTIPELIQRLSKHRAEYPYIVIDGDPWKKLHPIGEILSARIFETKLKTSKSELGYNPSILKAIRSEETPKIKYVIGHDGKIYELSTQPGEANFGGEKFKYMDILATPVGGL